MIASQAGVKLAVRQEHSAAGQFGFIQSGQHHVGGRADELLLGSQVDVLVTADPDVLVRSAARRGGDGRRRRPGHRSTTGRGVTATDILLDGTKWRRRRTRRAGIV